MFSAVEPEQPDVTLTVLCGLPVITDQRSLALAREVGLDLYHPVVLKILIRRCLLQQYSDVHGGLTYSLPDIDRPATDDVQYEQLVMAGWATLQGKGHPYVVYVRVLEERQQRAIQIILVKE